MKRLDVSRHHETYHWMMLKICVLLFNYRCWKPWHYNDIQTVRGLLTTLPTRAEPLSFRANKDLAGPKKTIIKIAL
jgi:hypothetical protein